jgi:beta-lactamase regulating signal transducer with metallopeptidase domain
VTAPPVAAAVAVDVTGAAGALAAHWWSWMAPMSVQILGLVLLVSVLDRALARWVAPQVRSALWLVALAKLLVPPSWASPLSAARLLPDLGLAHLGGAAGAASAAGAATALGPAASPAVAVAFAGWLAGVAVAAAIAFAGHRRVAQAMRCTTAAAPGWLRARADAAAARIGLRRAPPLRVAAAGSPLAGPALVGWRRPVIVLPASWLRHAAADELEHVLLHELTHLRRRDPWWALLAAAIHCAYWFHPAVWVLRRQLATLREIGCDAAVARSLGAAAAPAYRRTLLRLASSLVERRAVERRAAPALSFLHRQSQILARLASLERSLPRCPAAHRAVAAALVAALALCALPGARPGGEASAAARPSVALAALGAGLGGGVGAGFGAGMGGGMGTAAATPVDTGMGAGGASLDLVRAEPLGCLQRRYAVYRALAAAELSGR